MNWISESDAARKVNKAPKTLRRLVKSGKWPVNYTAPNGRGYQYSEKDLDKLLKSFSTVTNN